MRLSMVDQTGNLTGDERAALRQRLRFLLTRYSAKIQGVRLVLARDDSSATGDFYVCRGTVTMQDGRSREAEDRSDQLMTSATCVADRLGRAVARLVACEQPSRRRITGRI